jgi:hypothetical protein
MKDPTERLPSVQERDLTAVVADFLAGEGYKVRAEVSNLGQSADLVATKGRWVTFIEVKVRDWRSAIAQCVAHRLVADFICVAVGTKNISTKLLQAAEESGIGLIHIDSTQKCLWAVKPRINEAIWRPQRKEFSLKLQAVDYVC